MKYLDEYRDAEQAFRLAEVIQRLATRRWRIMEVCGGQTHSIVRNGIDQLLPDSVELIHGPGCPVCVTSLDTIDKAQAIAARPEVIFCSFGDMLRVPGSSTDLFGIRGAGGDVRIVYSPLDAMQLAKQNPDRQVVFFAVGFETTAPAIAMAVKLAQQQRVSNFSLLVSHVLVPPAIASIMDSPHTQVEAFLAAGHVCSVMGYWQYPALASRYNVPIVVTGFEPLDILQGIRLAVVQLESGCAKVENAYSRVVKFVGNESAQRVLHEVFEVTDRQWRGMGLIPGSGWQLRAAYHSFDAERRFALEGARTSEPSHCRSGDVLQGIIKPDECPAFGKQCTPRNPLGAPMVSGEGACAAYYNYGRTPQPQSAL